MVEEETREQIENIINNNEESVKEQVKEEVKEEIKETILEERIKPKAKAKSKSRAKPRIKIVKESVEPIVEEPIVVEEEKPKKIDKLKRIVKCPDCNLEMTVHTLKYIHKRRGLCKAVVKEEPEKPVPEPVQPVASVSYAPQKPKIITEDAVNDYIKQNPDIIFVIILEMNDL